MKFKQLRINSSRELLVYPAKSKSVQRKTMVAKVKPSATQKTMSSSAATTDNSEVKGAKEML